MARKSGFVRRSGRMRRETEWIGLAAVSNTLSAGSTAVLSASLNAAALALRPFTVVRTRGIFQLRTDQSAASEFYHAGFGICVVSDQAIAVGVSAVPTPETEQASDLWFVYEELAAEFELGDATGFQSNAGMLAHFDSKAMRRVNGDQDVAIVKETSAVSLGAIAMHSGRMLVKLH